MLTTFYSSLLFYLLFYFPLTFEAEKLILMLGIGSDGSSQSYKQFTLVIYDSRVVIWGIFKSGTTLES